MWKYLFGQGPLNVAYEEDTVHCFWVSLAPSPLAYHLQASGHQPPTAAAGNQNHISRALPGAWCFTGWTAGPCDSATTLQLGSYDSFLGVAAEVVW